MKSYIGILSEKAQQFCYLIILSIFLATSCEIKVKDKSTPEIKNDNQRSFDRSKFLEGKKFISRSGNSLGMDSDAEILFQADQKVTLVESGLDSARYDGTFSVNEKTGEIDLKLPKYKKIWPKMKLEIRGGRALIFRSDGHTYMTPELKDAKEFQNFWPFAEV